MQLENQSRLGEYEIVSPLGKGGMGTVYLARDRRLRRDVAIKILADPTLAHELASERVLQEARSAARLNHPHICTVHEVVTSDECSFIVMERVEGRPLSAMIPAAGMPVEAVTRYGAQIADALAHAHERGIIHRDLKSGNVMVTPDGRVKVLDFGIAMSIHGDPNENTALEPAWESGPAGTLAYMAPEVLNGEPATPLSDVWSLGVVLHEMAAGRRPFRERTAVATASAILQGTPPALPDHVPASVRAVVLRCLARVPGERYQHASEVRAALDVLHATQTQSVEAPDLAPTRRPRSIAHSWSIAAVLALIAIGAATAWRLQPKEAPLLVSSQHPIGAFGASYRQATFSPDGGLIAFADAGTPVSQIWIKNLAQGDPVQITSGDVPALHPAWSPKNEQIVFAQRGQGLWSVPPLGGTARRLIEFGESPQFSADGERLVFERNGREIWTAGADGSEVRRVEGVPVPWYPGGLDPSLSPDGSSIVYFLPELGPNGDLWIVAASGGTPRQLTHDLTEAGGPIWTKDGRFIIFSSMRGGSRTLWRVRAEGGMPEPVTAGAGEDVEPALSRDGHTLLYTNVRNRWEVRALDPATGAQRVIVERRRQAIFPRVSPDGSQIALFGYGDVGDVQIFVMPVRGGPVQQVTHGQGYINTFPRWAPDGSVLYYYEQRPGGSLRSIPVGGGASRQVRPWTWETHTHAEISPDGSTIVYYRQGAPGERDVVPRTVMEDVRSLQARTLAVAIQQPRWSPDGRTIVGQTTGALAGMIVADQGANRPVVAVCPADGGACRALGLGRVPVWSPDGSRIFFQRDTANPAVKTLWSMTADGRDERQVFDRMGPYRMIDVMFDVSRNGEIVWSAFLEGRHELWQASVRP